LKRGLTKADAECFGVIEAERHLYNERTPIVSRVASPIGDRRARDRRYFLMRLAGLTYNLAEPVLLHGSNGIEPSTRRRFCLIELNFSSRTGFRLLKAIDRTRRTANLGCSRVVVKSRFDSQGFDP
jgi:hypothetical protein